MYFYSYGMCTIPSRPSHGKHGIVLPTWPSGDKVSAEPWDSKPPWPWASWRRATRFAARAFEMKNSPFSMCFGNPSIRDVHFNRIKTYFWFLVNPNKKQQDKYITSWIFQANSRHQVGLGGHQALHVVSGSGTPWDLVLTITHSHILKYHRKFWSNMKPFSSLSPTFKISRYVHIFPCQISCLHPAFLNLFMWKYARFPDTLWLFVT